MDVVQRYVTLINTVNAQKEQYDKNKKDLETLEAAIIEEMKNHKCRFIPIGKDATGQEKQLTLVFANEYKAAPLKERKAKLLQLCKGSQEGVNAIEKIYSEKAVKFNVPQLKLENLQPFNGFGFN